MAHRAFRKWHPKVGMSGNDSEQLGAGARGGPRDEAQSERMPTEVRSVLTLHQFRSVSILFVSSHRSLSVIFRQELGNRPPGSLRRYLPESQRPQSIGCLLRCSTAGGSGWLARQRLGQILGLSDGLLQRPPLADVPGGRKRDLVQHGAARRDDAREGGAAMRRHRRRDPVPEGCGGAEHVGRAAPPDLAERRRPPAPSRASATCTLSSTACARVRLSANSDAARLVVAVGQRHAGKAVARLRRGFGRRRGPETAAEPPHSVPRRAPGLPCRSATSAEIEKRAADALLIPELPAPTRDTRWRWPPRGPGRRAGWPRSPGW